MFEEQVKKAEVRAVFTEFYWNLNWCNSGAADPLSLEEPWSLGVLSLNSAPPDFVPDRGRRPIVPPMGGARDDLTMRVADADDVKSWQKFWTRYPAAA